MKHFLNFSRQNLNTIPTLLWYKNYWCREYHRLDSLRNGFWDRSAHRKLCGECSQQHRETEFELAYSCNKDTSQSHRELWHWGDPAELPSVEGRGSGLCPMHHTFTRWKLAWGESITLGKATPLHRGIIPREGSSHGLPAGNSSKNLGEMVSLSCRTSGWHIIASATRESSFFIWKELSSGFAFHLSPHSLTFHHWGLVGRT